ncbi:hypothetical protein VNO80_27443 [Phaseolus coccineus]|uniref:EF-hand domain-containing protein n=1 Tax=Phaseolus coccineus TaxID=3886 RepID=A0AAN9LJP2_PHACN
MHLYKHRNTHHHLQHIHIHILKSTPFILFDLVMARIGKGVEFEDLLPVIADKLGGEGLIDELCKGFQVLMDKEKGVITLESLRRNSATMGLQDFKEDELASMMREGDLDGDGALSQMEFCVLMFRLSPQLMQDSWFWLQQALLHHQPHHNDSL